MPMLPVKGKCFNFTGRIDFSDTDKPLLVWPGSYVAFSFDGIELSLKVENRRHWNSKSLGFVCDGKESLIELEDGEQTVTLAENLKPGRHNCYIYKSMSGGYLSLLGIDPGAGRLLDPIPKPKKRIEFYGDSVTAGEVVDADGYEGMPDPESNNGQWDNSWHSYAMRIGRMLPAEVYNTSQGGIALLDGTGYFEMPNTRGLESCYDKLRYRSDEEITKWDFSRFRPHVIVFAVGQNDSHPNPDCIYDRVFYRAKWEERYIDIINRTRRYSPNAAVILALTVLNHDPAWDEAIEEIKDKLGGEKNKVYHFVYTRCGRLTPGHPRNKEQIEMANELAAFLKTLPDSTWRG